MLNNPYNELLDIVSATAKTHRPPSVAIGKVIASPPDIQIQYKDFILEKEEVWISHYLLVGYERTAKGHIVSATQSRGGGGGYAEFASHNHDIHNDYTDNIIYTDTLKPGDYVSILPIHETYGDRQQYLVLDKVVHL